VRHVRIPVATLLRLLASGLSEPEILSEYPDLQTEDIRECLRSRQPLLWSGWLAELSKSIGYFRIALWAGGNSPARSETSASQF
jgi:hypothetical protein